MSQSAPDTTQHISTRHTDITKPESNLQQIALPLSASLAFELELSTQVLLNEPGSTPCAMKLDIAHKFGKLTWHAEETNAIAILKAELWRPVLTRDINGTDSYSNLVGLTAFVFDVKFNTPINQIIESLDGLKAVVHSVNWHKSNDQRCRVIIPIDGTITMDDHLAFYRYFQVKLKGRLGDFAGFSAYHWFRLPACPVDAKDNYSMITLDGKVYDRARWLETINDVLGPRNGKAYPIYNKTLTVPVKNGATSILVPTPASTHHVDPALVVAQEVIGKAMMSSKVDVLPSGDLMPSIASAHETSMPSTSLPASTSEISSSKTVIEEYTFPDDYELSSTTTQELMDSIKKLILEAPSAEDYFDVRGEYCSTSLELNKRGLWAPAFRPSMLIPKFSKERTHSEITVHRDHVFIDCHWLHSTQAVIHTKLKWEAIFDTSKEFPFDLGETFATENIRSDYRTESILNLTVRQQLQMRTLRGSDVIMHEKAIRKHGRDKDGKLIASPLKAIRNVIDRWCEIQPRVRDHQSKYLAHSEARLLLKVVSAPSWHEIAQLGGLIQGVDPLGDKTVGDFMKKLDLKVKEFSAPAKL